MHLQLELSKSTLAHSPANKARAFQSPFAPQVMTVASLIGSIENMFTPVIVCATFEKMTRVHCSRSCQVKSHDVRLINTSILALNCMNKVVLHINLKMLA